MRIWSGGNTKQARVSLPARNEDTPRRSEIPNGCSPELGDRHASWDARQEVRVSDVFQGTYGICI